MLTDAKCSTKKTLQEKISGVRFESEPEQGERANPVLRESDVDYLNLKKGIYESDGENLMNEMLYFRKPIN